MAGAAGRDVVKTGIKSERAHPEKSKLSVSVLMSHGSLPGKIPVYAQCPSVLINTTSFILKSMPV